MKAWVLNGVADLTYKEVGKPVLTDEEVLVRVYACGICGSDIPRIYRDGAHRMPLIPGHEFSGEVVEVANPSLEKWLGKRVGVFPLIPCRECIACKRGSYELCRSYSYLGSRRDGAFAQYVAVPADNLIELPGEVSYEQAAMLEPMAVAVHALRRFTLNESDRIVVCGLGTIGLFMTMLLKQQGIKNLFVIGNKDFQKKQIQSLGIDADNFCDSRSEDVHTWLMNRTENAGADIFFECVGKNETVSQAIDLTAPGGKICLVGNPASDMKLDKQTYWKILRNQLELTGTWNSSFFGQEEMQDFSKSDWTYVLKLLRQGKIRPEQFISHAFPLGELDKGLLIMRDKTEDYAKIMVTA